MKNKIYDENERYTKEFLEDMLKFKQPLYSLLEEMVGEKYSIIDIEGYLHGEIVLAGCKLRSQKQIKNKKGD